MLGLMDTARAAYRVDDNVGLTITHNRMKDAGCDEPRILELRALHEEMDRAVLVAYRWSDVAVPAYCPVGDEGKRAVDRFEAEGIDRLFALNARRAEEERLRGLAADEKTRPKAEPDGGVGSAKKKTRKTAPDAEPRLPGLK